MPHATGDRNTNLSLIWNQPHSAPYGAIFSFPAADRSCPFPLLCLDEVAVEHMFDGQNIRTVRHRPRDADPHASYAAAKRKTSLHLPSLDGKWPTDWMRGVLE